MDAIRNFEKENIELMLFGINEGQVDRYIYKYRTIEQAVMFLENPKLKFSVRKEFNDPHDCLADIDTDNTEDEITNYLVQNGRSPDYARECAKEFMNNPLKWKEIVHEAINSEIDGTGIFCGTIHPDNELMWAHYSEAHGGVCLKFDILLDPELFFFPKRVVYQDDFPTYNYLRNQGGPIENQIFTKSTKWAYEDEIRIIKQGIGSSLRVVKKEALIEIIIGCKTHNDDINKIIGLVQKNGFKNVTIKKASVNEKSYKLNIELF